MIWKMMDKVKLSNHCSSLEAEKENSHSRANNNVLLYLKI